ncbi:hypothetical protein J3R83DRAFT_10537 [Lanmaoa asiatica]|nr:hypothetical protein J3R83DRAFT_10537 [Lanmaoa asiatica]
MAPQTRSTTKSSPGRSTRNSIFGRPPLPPPKHRNTSTDKSPVRSALAHDTEAEGKVTLNASDIKGTPWLACRDAYGITTTVAVSETGEGIHVRWYYPDDECEVNEDVDVDVEMTIDEERGATPTTTAGPSNPVRRPFPQTPAECHPYDAGSVIQTPVKKAKPLQPSPPRIGDKGIRCLFEKKGVLHEFNGGARVVLRHPVGSTANLSREQVEHLEKEREEKIIQTQVERLLAQKQQLKEEEEYFSDSGYEDDSEMETELHSFQHDLRREGTDDTILISRSELSDIVPPVSPETKSTSSFFRGPNGELLDRQGRQMFGREGTILVDSTYTFPRRVMREKAFLTSTDMIDHFSSCASKANRLCQARFGPGGTELVD